MAELEHDVIGNVDHVVDAGDATGFEAVFEPRGRRQDFYAADDAGGETSAQFRGADFDFDGVGGFGGGFRRFWRNLLEWEFVESAHFARDAVMAEAIRAIGGNFCVDHGAVRTIFDAGNVISRKREARGELFRRRGDGDEVWKPAVEDLHDGRP